jgi:methionine-rich copper-binding protein CopC
VTRGLSTPPALARAARLICTPVAALALVGLCPGTSEPHASLVSATPAARAVVSTPPARVVLIFNERLEPAYSRVSVWDAAGQQVDAKDGALDPANPTAIRVSLPPLGPGRYVVRYRVLSVDGHIVEASFPFSIAPRPRPP